MTNGSLLEQIALFGRDGAIKLAPGDGREHGLEGLVETVARSTVGVEDCEHLIGSDELLGKVAVDVTLDRGLLGLHLEVLGGGVDVNGLLDVARGDLDREDLTLLHRVDLVEDDPEAADGRALEGHAVDDLWSFSGDLVADQGAVGLDVVTVVNTDPHEVAIVVDVEYL